NILILESLTSVVLTWFRNHPALHSFPTRRSSDLTPELRWWRWRRPRRQQQLRWRWWRRRKAEGKPAQHPGEEAGTLRSPRLQAKDRKSTRLNSSHVAISYAVFCLKKKNNTRTPAR